MIKVRCCSASTMATGFVPASCSTLSIRDSSLGFVKSLDFVKFCDMKKRSKYVRTEVSVIRNSNSSQDIVELQPASQGSPLLGIILSNLNDAFGFA